MPKSELRKIFWFSALLGFKGCSREGVVALSHPLAMGTYIGYDCTENGLEGGVPSHGMSGEGWELRVVNIC